jgi:hypothetical protein
MPIGITDLIAGIFKPAAELVDELHTSTEEKLKAKGHLLDVQAAAMQRVYDYEAETLSARAKIVDSEAKSDHWLTATWRPILMLTFGFLVVLRFLGFEADGMTEAEYLELWSLVKLGLTGYVIARSGEKIAKTLKQ